MDAAKLRWLAAGTIAALLAAVLLAVALRASYPPPAIEVKLPDAPATDGVLKVYVSGAVARPGLYQLQPGERYADALAAAGGPTDEAETLAVNLARRVRDEDQVHVPRRGDAALGGQTVSATAPLDLNSATVAQLEALPGIGAVRAQKIVESRGKEGAFRSADELVQRKLLPQSTLDGVRELVQVQ